ncbi:hypothetical protein TKK_0009977 [Trichogramma kaykai]
MSKPKTIRKRSSDQSCSVPAKKQAIDFQLDWLRDPVLKDWLVQNPTDSRSAFCNYYHCPLKFSKKSDLTKHALTPKHVENINCSKKSGSYQEIVIEGPSLKERTTVVEYKTAQFIAVHPVNPEAVQQMKMKHTKCTGIIKDVLYKSAFSEIVDILNEVPYSVLVDESTDVSNTKLFCISVKYYSFRLQKSVQHFLSFVELDPLNSKAPDLFESFRKFFIESKISLNNLIAVSSDNANVMTGTKNSFYTNLRDVVPNAISLNCICHSMALIAKSSTNSTSKTLKPVEDLARDISGYFCKSPKRTEELSAKLKFHELPDTKILRLSGTRWLEGYHVFDRILNHWPALIDFFDEECNPPSKNKSSDKPSQLPKPSKKVSTIKPPKEIKPTKAKISLESMNDVSNQVYILVFLGLKYALDSEKREEIADLSGVCNEFFPFIDLESIAFEWRTLPSYFDSQKEADYLNLDVEKFWSVIFNLKINDNNGFAFSSLRRLVLNSRSNRTSTELLNARCFLKSFKDIYGEVDFGNFNLAEFDSIDE